MNKYIRCFADLQQFTALETNSYPAPFRHIPFKPEVSGKICQADSAIDQLKRDLLKAGAATLGRMNGSLDEVVRAMLRDVVRDEVREALREFRETQQSAREQAPAEDRYLTAPEAADIAGVTPSTVRTWVRRGELTGSRAGRLLRIKYSELRAYLERPSGPADAVSNLDIEKFVRESTEEDRTRCRKCGHLKKIHQANGCYARKCDCKVWSR